MLLISNDRYFRTGVEYLVNNIPPHRIRDLMIVDSSFAIYIMDASWFNKQCFKEPFEAFLYCNKFLFNKKIDANLFLKTINNYKNDKKFDTLITICEREVILSVCKGIPPKKIASYSQRSEKTISTHKMSALNKLNFKDVVTLYTLLYFWESNLSLIRNISTA
ncbi:response regulator transcription factor [Salmonella enterica]|nr:response regulator transcription factor [Salmonella enterica]EJC3639547.1 response regulator transcription factor [Salmonella enterica]